MKGCSFGFCPNYLAPPFPNYKKNVQVIKLGIGTTNLINRFVLSLASFLVGEEKALQSLPSLEVRKSTNHQVHQVTWS